MWIGAPPLALCGPEHYLTGVVAVEQFLLAAHIEW